MHWSVWIILALVLWDLLGRIGSEILEAFWPFRYYGVRRIELAEHIRQLWRRGMNGTRLVIAAGDRERQVVVRKYVLPGAEPIRVTVGVQLQNPNRRQRDAMQVAFEQFVNRNNWVSEHAGGGLLPELHRVEVSCGSSDSKAYEVVQRVLAEYWGVQESEDLCVWARGTVHWCDMVVDWSSVSWSVAAKVLAGKYPWGKPYKRCHLPNRYTLFGVVGLRWVLSRARDALTEWMRGMLRMFRALVKNDAADKRDPNE